MNSSEDEAEKNQAELRKELAYDIRVQINRYAMLTSSEGHQYAAIFADRIVDELIEECKI